ncbi:MAG: HYR domain-containing protein [Cytophagales bacterium]|nr:MAG: HYR domain-containing protein [Cytophagales bacterium]
MQTKFLSVLIFLCLSFLTGIAHAQQLITFSTIPGRPASEHYTCRVRLKNSATWENAFVLQTTAKQNVTGPNDYHNGYVENVEGWTASWIAFEFAAGNEVEVEISRVNGKPIRKAMARPVEDTKPALIRDGKVYVTFTKHANVNVDIDGQMEDQSTGQGYSGPAIHTICLFGNPIYRKPTSQGSRVKYLSPSEPIPADGSWDTLSFLPGVHRIFQNDANGVAQSFLIRSNQVIHIPGDAVVHGTFLPINNGGFRENYFGDGWAIYGSGTLSGEEIPHWRTGFRGGKYPFKGWATRIRLEGFVVADAAEHHFNISNKNDNDADVNIFKNLKTLAWRLNTDGGAMQRNTITTDCFFRVQDDLLYCCQNKSLLRNCVLWMDHHGSLGVFATVYMTNPASNPIRDLKFIYGRRIWHAGGTAGVRFSDARLGSRIPPYTISNVKVEDPFPSYGLFDFGMADDKPETIEPAPVFLDNGITFENFSQPNHANIPAVGVVPHNKMRTGQNTGANDELLFSNITFKNFAYLQIPTTSFEQARFTGKAGANVNFVVDCNNITNGGRIGANQIMGSALAPDPIVGETILDPNGGVLEYVWVKSTTDPNPTLVTGQIIPRATDPIYYPGLLTQTTYFRRFVRRAGCTDYVGSDNSVTITVFDGGEISTGIEAFCAGNKPDLFKNVRVPQGTGSVEYKWLKSTTGCPTAADAETITNGTGESLAFDQALTTTTYFQRFAQRPATFAGYAASNCIKVLIGPGLLTKYYTNTTATGIPQLTIIEEPSFKFNSSPQAIKDIMVLNQSSIGWTGSLKTDAAGVNSLSHTIVGTSDITINGQPWSNTGTAFANGRRTLNIALVQGTWYPITAKYIRTNGIDHQFVLNYTSPVYCPNPACNNLTDGGTIGANQEICPGQTPGSLSNVTGPTGGSGTIEYTWLSSTTSCPTSLTSSELLANATGADYSPGPLTQTTYFRRFSRRAGCSDFPVLSNCVTIQLDKTPPVFTSTPDNVTRVIASGSSAVVSYTTPTATDNCTSFTISRTGLASGSEFPVGETTVVHTATDASGNPASTSFTVTIVAAITANIAGSLTFCAGSSTPLTASGAGAGGTYRWSNGQTTATISVSTSGLYTVTATSAGGYSGTATVTVNAINTASLSQPMLSASSSVVCEGGVVAVTATAIANGALSYQWYQNSPSGILMSLGAVQQGAVLLLNGVQTSQAGNYVVEVKADGCASATSTAFMLTVNPSPTVTIAFPTSASVNATGPVITVPVGAGLSYQVFGGGNNGRYERKIIEARINGFEIRTVIENSTGVFLIDRAGPYTITVTDSNGCSRTVSGEVRRQE